MQDQAKVKIGYGNYSSETASYTKLDCFQPCTEENDLKLISEAEAMLPVTFLPKIVYTNDMQISRAGLDSMVEASNQMLVRMAHEGYCPDFV